MCLEGRCHDFQPEASKIFIFGPGSLGNDKEYSKEAAAHVEVVAGIIWSFGT